MGRMILAVVVAMIAATAVIWVGWMISTLLAPNTPNNLQYPSAADLSGYIASLPTVSFVVALIGYFLASFAGGFIVKNMSRRESPGLALPILIGTILTVGGILNFFVMLPGQPTWFVILSLLTFMPVTLLGAKFAGR